MARRNATPKVDEGDRRHLEEVLAAARLPAPTASTAWDVDVNPDHYDGLVEVLQRQSVRAAVQRLASAFLSADERGPMFEGWGWRWWGAAGLGLAGHNEKRRAVAAQLQELGRRVKVLPNAKDGQRVSLAEAITGAPQLKLPPTNRSTLYAWLRDEKTARILGTDWRAKRGAQRPLVAGLLQLHAAKSKRRPPGWAPRRARA